MERSIEMSKEVVVDGVRYLITHPSPDVGIKLGIELLNLMAAPAVGMGAIGNAESEDEKIKAAMASVRELMTKLTPDKFLDLSRRILSTVEIQEPKKQLLAEDHVFKLHFRGRLGSIVNLVLKTLEFTHEDFLKAIMAGIATMKTKGESQPA